MAVATPLLVPISMVSLISTYNAASQHIGNPTDRKRSWLVFAISLHSFRNINLSLLDSAGSTIVVCVSNTIKQQK